MALHVLRTRWTAALTRGFVGMLGLLLVSVQHDLTPRPGLAAIGFGIIFLSAVIQFLVPEVAWLAVEETLAAGSVVLIIGMGAVSVTALSVLWLVAVAAGVLARGGRVHWFGSAVVGVALLLPIVRMGSINFPYACLCLAAVALLLTCGRLTRELNHFLNQARYDADHDSLTGALSRSAFRTLLDDLAGAADVQAPIAMIMLDLAHFGQVNKFSGHAAGDAVLRDVVARIGDVIGADAIVGRLGGDEFATIVASSSAETVARDLLRSLGEANIATSVGIASAPRDGDDADTLLRAADVALRVAKRSGRNTYSVYSGRSLTDEGPEGARHLLDRFISGEGLAIAVQPIVDLHSRLVHAYEALARFEAEEGGSPLHWFALADELGMRQELELACLREALSVFTQCPRGRRFSVNLSGPLLLDERTQALLDQQPSLQGLMIEITEDQLVEDDQRMQAAIAPLIERGVSFAVDDMGAGYSGLRQIIALRPAYLKLDRALVQGIDADPERAAMVAAMLGYAERTGGHLVAEGVETEAELSTLLQLGVPLVQGYYLGRPDVPWPAGKGELIPALGGDDGLSVAA